MADRPVLDLTTDTERLTVRIDAVAYPLRSSNDLTLASFKDLERITPRVGVLLGQARLSETEDRELSQLLDAVCRIALVAPEAVHTRLRDLHRIPIVTVFSERLTPSLLRASADLMGRPPVDGTKSSRGSNGSTGARRQRGSPRRHSASSART